MGTVMERRPPFLTNFSYALLVDEAGRPMHKSSGNMVDFHDGAERIGVDVMRWMFLDHKPEVNLLFGYHKADETRRRFHIPLWNVYSFFVTYANLTPEWRPATWVLWSPVDTELSRQGNSPTNLPIYPSTNSDLLMDQWIVGRLQQVIERVTTSLADYDAENATMGCEAFLDDLSNWYVRRSRRRFWDGDMAALDTLYYVLVTFARVLAPMLPFMTEVIYQNLVRSAFADAPESVHHTGWPAANPGLMDEKLLVDMDLARAVVSLGHADRVAANIKVRQPLADIKVVAAGKADSLVRFAALIAEELNVKSVLLAEGEAELVQYRILPFNKTLGPRFGKDFPAVRKALSEADPYAVAAAVAAGQPVPITFGGQAVELAAEDVLVQAEPKPGYQVTNDTQRGIVVALDTVITPQLKAEGLAREVVRRIQQMRKDAGFDLSDRIHTTYQTDNADLAATVVELADGIKQETLSLSLLAGDPVEGAYADTGDVDGAEITLSVRRASR